MAQVMDSIVIQFEKRPCWYKTRNGVNQKALFHKWVDKRDVVKPMSVWDQRDVINDIFAIIEMEDGSMREVPPSKIRFADVSYFGNYTWRDPEV